MIISRAVWMIVSGAVAVLATPIMWWMLVATRDHPKVAQGLLAGGFAGATAHLLIVVPVWIWLVIPPDSGYAAIFGIAFTVMAIQCAAISAVICSFAGAGIVLVQRRSALRGGRSPLQLS